MAIITRMFKKFVKNAKENFKKGSPSKTRSSDCDKPSGCFRCGKHDHVLKNCPMQKEEQGLEQFRNRRKKPQLSGSAKRAMVAAWGETSEEEDSSQDEAEALVLMARSESEADSESDETMSQFKEKISGFNKRKILKFYFP